MTTVDEIAASFLRTVAEPTPLLDEALAFVLAHPEHHNQGFWLFTGPGGTVWTGVREPACGTTGCLAGWGAALHDPQLRVFNGEEVVLRDGRAVSIESYARHVFGITFSQSRYLFAGVRTVDELEIAIKEIKNDPAISLSDLEITVSRALIDRLPWQGAGARETS